MRHVVLPVAQDCGGMACRWTSDGPAAVYPFDCASGTGTTPDLVGSLFRVHLEIRSDSGVIYATTPERYIPAGELRETIMIDGGYFGFTWKAVCGGIACSGNANGVPVRVTAAGPAVTDVETLDTAGAWHVPLGDPLELTLTKALPTGSYTISLDTVDSTGSFGCHGSFADQLVFPPNQVTMLTGVLNCP